MDENKLCTARKIIDETDKEMARLFCRRMEAVKLVAKHKKENALPIFDPDREEQVILKNSQLVENEDAAVREAYVKFLRETMAISRAYQTRLLFGMRIAYSGTEGAFAHIAASKAFPQAEKIGYENFTKAYEAVVSGECDAAVLPIENSSAGEVGAVTDLIYSGPLYINRTCDLRVIQDLLVLPGADPAKITRVISHPQALGQCSEYIRKHGYSQIEYVNTALAAEYVSNLGDKSVAAIASEEAGEKFGLVVADRAINANENNTTRFAILSPVREKNANALKIDMRFMLMFTVKNEAGALAQAIDIIGKNGFNMRSLRSRPMKELLWQYYFCVEAEGNIDTDEGEAMMSQLSSCCDKLKLVGSYKA